MISSLSMPMSSFARLADDRYTFDGGGDEEYSEYLQHFADQQELAKRLMGGAGYNYNDSQHEKDSGIVNRGDFLFIEGGGKGDKKEKNGNDKKKGTKKFAKYARFGKVFAHKNPSIKHNKGTNTDYIDIRLAQTAIGSNSVPPQLKDKKKAKLYLSTQEKINDFKPKVDVLRKMIEDLRFTLVYRPDPNDENVIYLRMVPNEKNIVIPFDKFDKIRNYAKDALADFRVIDKTLDDKFEDYDPYSKALSDSLRDTENIFGLLIHTIYGMGNKPHDKADTGYDMGNTDYFEVLTAEDDEAEQEQAKMVDCFINGKKYVDRSTTALIKNVKDVKQLLDFEIYDPQSIAFMKKPEFKNFLSKEDSHDMNNRAIVSDLANFLLYFQDNDEERNELLQQISDANEDVEEFNNFTQFYKNGTVFTDEAIDNEQVERAIANLNDVVTEMKRLKNYFHDCENEAFKITSDALENVRKLKKRMHKKHLSKEDIADKKLISDEDKARLGNLMHDIKYSKHQNLRMAHLIDILEPTLEEMFKFYKSRNPEGAKKLTKEIRDFYKNQNEGEEEEEEEEQSKKSKENYKTKGVDEYEDAYGNKIIKDFSMFADDDDPNASKMYKAVVEGDKVTLLDEEMTEEERDKFLSDSYANKDKINTPSNKPFAFNNQLLMNKNDQIPIGSSGKASTIRNDTTGSQGVGFSNQTPAQQAKARVNPNARPNRITPRMLTPIPKAGIDLSLHPSHHASRASSKQASRASSRHASRSASPTRTVANTVSDEQPIIDLDPSDEQPITDIAPSPPKRAKKANRVVVDGKEIELSGDEDEYIHENGKILLDILGKPIRDIPTPPPRKKLIQSPSSSSSNIDSTLANAVSAAAANSADGPAAAAAAVMSSLQADADASHANFDADDEEEEREEGEYSRMQMTDDEVEEPSDESDNEASRAQPALPQFPLPAAAPAPPAPPPAAAAAAAAPAPPAAAAVGAAPPPLPAAAAIPPMKLGDAIRLNNLYLKGQKIALDKEKSDREGREKWRMNRHTERINWAKQHRQSALDRMKYKLDKRRLKHQIRLQRITEDMKKKDYKRKVANEAESIWRNNILFHRKIAEDNENVLNRREDRVRKIVRENQNDWINNVKFWRNIAIENQNLENAKTDRERRIAQEDERLEWARQDRARKIEEEKKKRFDDNMNFILNHARQNKDVGFWAQRGEGDLENTLDKIRSWDPLGNPINNFNNFNGNRRMENRIEQTVPPYDLPKNYPIYGGNYGEYPMQMNSVPYPMYGRNGRTGRLTNYEKFGVPSVRMYQQMLRTGMNPQEVLAMSRKRRAVNGMIGNDYADYSLSRYPPQQPPMMGYPGMSEYTGYKDEDYAQLAVKAAKGLLYGPQRRYSTGNQIVSSYIPNSQTSIPRMAYLGAKMFDNFTPQSMTNKEKLELMTDRVKLQQMIKDVDDTEVKKKLTSMADLMNVKDESAWHKGMRIAGNVASGGLKAAGMVAENFWPIHDAYHRYKTMATVGKTIGNIGDGILGLLPTGYGYKRKRRAGRKGKKKRCKERFGGMIIPPKNLKKMFCKCKK